MVGVQDSVTVTVTRVVAVFVSVIVEVELTGTVTTVEKSAVEVVVCGGSIRVEVAVIDTVAVEVGRVAVTGTVDVISERVACVFGGRVTVSVFWEYLINGKRGDECILSDFPFEF
uniref:Uncharacterized protein n=1 Tax=Anopheles coluzzii TaxID=1518534 RepID=A0A8W7PYS3_ANOCL